MLAVRELSLSLGGRTILDGLSLEVARESFHLVLGPNGAGKSSLLKCILGLHRHKGEILIEGRSATGISARERAVMMAYVPQFLDLQFNLDVRSLMNLSRYAHDDEHPDIGTRIIQDALEQTETTHLVDAFIDQLSGGERQRVMIAAALAQKPRLLILDEPSTSMDPGHRRDMVRLLARLHQREHMTLLVVTHDWNEYLHLNPRVSAIKEGRLAFQCQAHDLRSHLDALFGCAFHHYQNGDHWLSLPRWE